jgi:hypothetical protein
MGTHSFPALDEIEVTDTEEGNDSPAQEYSCSPFMMHLKPYPLVREPQTVYPLPTTFFYSFVVFDQKQEYNHENQIGRFKGTQ